MTADGTATQVNPVIHVGLINRPRRGSVFLILRKDGSDSFRWYEERGEHEEATEVCAHSVEEACRLAHREWKTASFRTLRCGWVYPGPERDEHGVNAYFYQMIQGYRSGNGEYWDENGIPNKTNFASDEALNKWREMERQGRLGW